MILSMGLAFEVVEYFKIQYFYFIFLKFCQVIILRFFSNPELITQKMLGTMEKKLV